MHEQMEILLQIQDLKGQRRELAEGESARQIEEEFNLDVDRALADLDSKIAELEGELDPTVRRRYERLSASLTRTVVPVIQGTCYGCFVSVATSVAWDPAERSRLRTCENCGRFLYFG